MRIGLCLVDAKFVQREGVRDLAINSVSDRSEEDVDAGNAVLGLGSNLWAILGVKSNEKYFFSPNRVDVELVLLSTYSLRGHPPTI